MILALAGLLAVGLTAELWLVLLAGRLLTLPDAPPAGLCRALGVEALSATATRRVGLAVGLVAALIAAGLGAGVGLLRVLPR